MTARKERPTIANHGRNHPAQSFDEMLETGLEKKKSSGLYKARSLELTDERLSGLIAKTAAWLELFRDSCSDVLAESSLRNNCNPVVSIFHKKPYITFVKPLK